MRGGSVDYDGAIAALPIASAFTLLLSLLLLALISTTAVFIFLEKCRGEVIRTTN